MEVNERRAFDSKFTIPEFTVPRDDKYWYVVKKYNERPCVEEIKSDMRELIGYLQNAE